MHSPKKILLAGLQDWYTGRCNIRKWKFCIKPSSLKKTSRPIECFSQTLAHDMFSRQLPVLLKVIQLSTPPDGWIYSHLAIITVSWPSTPRRTRIIQRYDKKKNSSFLRKFSLPNIPSVRLPISEPHRKIKKRVKTNSSEEVNIWYSYIAYYLFFSRVCKGKASAMVNDTFFLTECSVTRISVTSVAL